MRDHKLHASHFFGRRAVLARRAFAVAASGHQHGETVLPQTAGADRPLIVDGQPGMGKVTEPIVEMRQDRDWRNLIGRDVIAQRPGLVKRHGLPLQLGLH